MNLDDLIARFRAGNPADIITEMLAANPGLTREALAVHAIGWQVDAITEPVLRSLLAEQPEHAIAHDHLAQLLYRHNRFIEAKPHFEAVCRHMPERSFAWSGLCTAQGLGGDIVGIRDSVAKAQANIPEGEHLNSQHGRPLINYLDQAATVDHRARLETRIIDEISRRQAAAKPDSLPNKTVDRDPPETPAAQTVGATAVGLTGLTLVGRVAAPGPVAEYRFEYGATPDRLDHHTDWCPLPGPLNAEVSLAPDTATFANKLYAGTTAWDEDQGAYVLDWPFGKDPNHISGVGFLDLVAGFWHNSCNADGFQEIHEWEASDLRDAVLRLDLTPSDFAAKEFLHCAGVGNGSSYWFLTACPIDLETMEQDTATTVEFGLTSDPALWTAAGNNSLEQANADRYRYGPLNDALSRNMGNLVFTGCFGNWRDTPTGRLGFADVALRYRSRGLLHPGNGARPTIRPEVAACDPARLTDGVRGRLDGAWYHLGPADPPPIFAWDLAGEQTIATFVFHQDVAFPTRHLNLRLTLCGTEVHAAKITFADPKDSFAARAARTIHRLDPPVIADAIEITFLEGLSDQSMGMQDIEVFATDFIPPPCREPVTVSWDVGSLAEPAVFFRVVCRTEQTTEVGDILEAPLNRAPAPRLLLFEQESSATADKALFRVRGNAMGRKTTLQWRVDGGNWRNIPMGWEDTAVDRWIAVPNQPSEQRLMVRLQSDAGHSDKWELSF